ncbi:hypothetical protein SAY87_009851 [Trapa incisa]|uniref:KOW domain-containing protein n=1 Tax=Trapa incisa TaxID=236973 RepID=A0AAN7PYQ8_9MYRT|nr:hypothetical protein SAY87_009851 [Trapa incisa]
MVSDKGKQPAGKSSGKRKFDDDKTGGNKPKKRGVLKFIDDIASVSDDGSSSDDSMFDDEEESDLGNGLNNDKFKSHNPSVLKAESEEGFDKIKEERHKNVSSFLRFIEEDSSIPSVRDPTTWKVKCMAGRERYSVFCLMQKYVDLQAMGNKLKIISAYAVERVKSHIFVEAEKQAEVTESCRGLCSVYATRVTPVPRKEVPHLLSVCTRRPEISEGMWARVKSGTYKGDLAQVVAVNDVRRRVTVKLIPRIDFQAMAEKFGGGCAQKKSGAPAPKLVSSSELDEFRPLICYRRDRETDEVFQVLDGLTLKDGYLYKRVAMDSLSFWGVMPSDEELLKFQPHEDKESSEMEWLDQLYGDKKKTQIVKFEKGGEKGAGPSDSPPTKKYVLYDLVSLGQKDFGVIVGIEKDDYKILKEGAEGHILQNVAVNDIKNGPIDAKFTAMDKHQKLISANDTVRILEGPLKDRQGIVRQIYRGIIFIYDDNELENGGYICSKAQYCEKIKPSVDSFTGKGGEPSTFAFDDLPSSPKSPLSPEKSWQARGKKRDFNQGERDGFSVGQTLRIRVGPLKGYTCRVIAVRRTDITVKLDSKQKILTVKSEHLAEVPGRSSAILMREEPDSSTVNPFNLLGNEGSTDWTGRAGASDNDGGWNSGGPSAAWSSWSNLPSSGFVAQNNSADPSSSSAVSKKDAEDGGWGSKIVPKQMSTWGTTTTDDHVVSGNDQSDGWKKDGDATNNATMKGSTSGLGWGSWGKSIPQNEGSSLPSTEGGGSWATAAGVRWGRNNDSGKSDDSSWNKQKPSTGDGGASWSSWNKVGSSSEAVHGTLKDRDSWGDANQKMKEPDISSSEKTKDENSSWTSWKKPESSSVKWKGVLDSDGWGKREAFPQESEPGNSSWNKPRGGFEQDGCLSLDKDGGSCKKQDGGSLCEMNREGGECSKFDSPWDKTGGGSSWNKGIGGNTWNKQDGGSSWGKTREDSLNEKQDRGSWNDKSGGSKKSVGSSWNINSGGSSWNKQDDGSPWSKSAATTDDGGSWMKDGSSNKQEGASWSKNAGGSSWNKSTDDGSWGKKAASSWGQQDRSSSWSQQTGSSFWDKGENDGQHDTFGGSGGRRGRGGRGRDGRDFRGRGRGGRDFRGRGRSFDHDQTSEWKAGWRGSTSRGGRWSSGEGSRERGLWSSNPSGSTGSWNRGGSDSRPNSFGADGGSSCGGAPEKGSSWSDQVGGTWKAGENNGSGSGRGTWQKDLNSSGWNKPGSWNTPKASDGGGSSWDHEEGWKKPEGNSWGKKKEGSGFGDDKKNDAEGSSWGKKEDSGADKNWGNLTNSSGGWNKPVGNSWGKKKEDSGFGDDKKNDVEGSSWGKKEDTGADKNWGSVINSSGGCEKPEGNSWGKKKEDSGFGDGKKNDDEGSSWGKKEDINSSGGWKKPEGNSWGKKKEDLGFGDDKKNDPEGSSWGKKEDMNSSGGWKKPEGNSWGKKKEDSGFGGDKKNDAEGSSWGKKEDINSSGGWKKPEGNSWGKKKEDSGFGDDKKNDAEGSSWGKKDDSGADKNWGNLTNSSGGWKKPEGNSWGKKQEDSAFGDDNKNDAERSSWGKKEDSGAADNNWGNVINSSGGWKKPEGNSWGKKKEDSGFGDDKTKDAEGSSWGKKKEDSRFGDGKKSDAEGSSWDMGGAPWNNKQDEDSSRGRRQARGGSSLGKGKEVCSWESEEGDGGSSWNSMKQDGGYSSWGNGSSSSWNNKQDGGESSRSAGRTSWNTDGGEGGEGSSGHQKEGSDARLG